MQLQQLSAGRGALTAVRMGEGRDLVLLHSLLADRLAFDPVLPKLAAKHRVTLFNLPGFHGSQPAMLALMDAYLAVIEDGFDEFGIGKDSVLIGNGFGGTVALAFALAHPERISKLVAERCRGRFSRRRDAKLSPHGGKGSRRRPGQHRRDRRKTRFLAGLSRRASGEDRGTQASPVGHRPKAFQAACKILQEADLVPMLHHMKVPTLVVCGEFDQATPPALNKQIVDKVSGAKYIELHGCGHCPPLEQPEQFLSAIKEFVGL